MCWKVEVCSLNLISWSSVAIAARTEGVLHCSRGVQPALKEPGFQYFASISFKKASQRNLENRVVRGCVPCPVYWDEHMENNDASGIDQDTHSSSPQIHEESETVSTVVPDVCSGSCDSRVVRSKVHQCLARGSEVDSEMSTDFIATATGPVRPKLLMKYMENLHFDYRNNVLKELGLFYSTWRAVNRYVLHTPDFSQEYEDMIRIIGEIHDAAWTLLKNAKRFNYRFGVQDKLVREFLAGFSYSTRKNPKRMPRGRRLGSAIL